MGIIRLNKVIKEFNVGLQTVVDFLGKKGHSVNASPSEKITEEQYDLLKQEFGADKSLKNEAEKILQNRLKEKEKVQKKAAPEVIETRIPEEMKPQVVVKGTIDLNPKAQTASQPEQKPEPETPVVEEKVAKVEVAEDKEIGRAHV